MEHFNITATANGFRIEGFPDALKVIGVDGPQARRLSDLALHKSDLEFAAECLGAINKAPDTPIVLRQALWRAATIHYMKCFGDSGARFQLSAKKIYNGNPAALLAFDYFKNLRNKHFVHDENAYAQSIPGAILNQRGHPNKIEKIVCLNAIAETLVQDNYSNLHSLIGSTREWVVAQFDELCDLLTSELEALPFEELERREAITYTAPTLNALEIRRDAP